MKVSSRTTCSTALARTPSRTDAFTKVNLTKTGEKKSILLSFYFMQMWMCDAFPGVGRLEGDGAFTDPQGQVWKGKFQGKTAPGLKLLNSF